MTEGWPLTFLRQGQIYVQGYIYICMGKMLKSHFLKCIKVLMAESYNVLLAHLSQRLKWAISMPVLHGQSSVHNFK